MRPRQSSRLLLLAILLVSPAVDETGAQRQASPEAARALVSALTKAGLDTVAAADPAEPGSFVAALHIEGGQLLVVSTRHPSDAAVTHRIAARQYRDVYLDLQGTPTPKGKFFVQDAGADGIVDAKRGSGSVDVLYEDGVTQTMFNGDPKSQKLTEAQYEAKLESADARYARILTLLTDAVRPAPPAAAGQGAGG